HEELLARFPAAFPGACFVSLGDGPDPRSARAPADVPVVALYLYGGGYLNGAWGDRKATLTTAVRRWAAGPVGRDPVPVIASGLQLDAGYTATPAFAAMLAGARIVLTRDRASATALAGRVGELPVRSGADDA